RCVGAARRRAPLTRRAALRCSRLVRQARSGIMSAALALLALSACDEKKAEGPAPERFAAVKKSAAAKAASFCEKSYPAKERKFSPAASRLLGTAAAPARGWKWVNVWATWCEPW